MSDVFFCYLKLDLLLMSELRRLYRSIVIILQRQKLWSVLIPLFSRSFLIHYHFLIGRLTLCLGLIPFFGGSVLVCWRFQLIYLILEKFRLLLWILHVYRRIARLLLRALRILCRWEVFRFWCVCLWWHLRAVSRLRLLVWVWLERHAAERIRIYGFWHREVPWHWQIRRLIWQITVPQSLLQSLLFPCHYVLWLRRIEYAKLLFLLMSDRNFRSIMQMIQIRIRSSNIKRLIRL